MIKLSVVIVTYNSSNVIEEAIRSVCQFGKQMDLEIIVVDNNSKDDTVDKASRISDEIIFIRNMRNVGFASANNQAFSIATGDIIAILNPDIMLTAETDLQGLIQKLVDDDKIGILAPRLYYADGTIQESARGFPNPFAQLIRGLKLDRHFKSFRFYQSYMIKTDQIEKDSEVDWVIGAFMLIRKDILTMANYFDGGYFMYYEDADLCMKVRKLGYKIIYTPDFSAIHLYQRDSSKQIFSNLKAAHVKSILRFYCKHTFNLLLR